MLKVTIENEMRKVEIVDLDGTRESSLNDWLAIIEAALNGLGYCVPIDSLDVLDDEIDPSLKRKKESNCNACSGCDDCAETEKDIEEANRLSGE